MVLEFYSVAEVGNGIAGLYSKRFMSDIIVEVMEWLLAGKDILFLV